MVCINGKYNDNKSSKVCVYMCVKVWLLKLKKADRILSHPLLLFVSASICHSHCFLSAVCVCVCVLQFVCTHACICVCVCVVVCLRCHAESSCTVNVLREPKGHTVLNTSA